MGSFGDDHLLGVFIFFLTLNTIVVSLRLYVRLWLKKSAFGWDDVFLILTYVSIQRLPIFLLLFQYTYLGSY